MPRKAKAKQFRPVSRWKIKPKNVEVLQDRGSGGSNTVAQDHPYCRSETCLSSGSKDNIDVVDPNIEHVDVDSNEEHQHSQESEVIEVVLSDTCDLGDIFTASFQGETEVVQTFPASVTCSSNAEAQNVASSSPHQENPLIEDFPADFDNTPCISPSVSPDFSVHHANVMGVPHSPMEVYGGSSDIFTNSNDDRPATEQELLNITSEFSEVPIETTLHSQENHQQVVSQTQCHSPSTDASTTFTNAVVLLRSSLPPHWVPLLEDEGLHILKMSSGFGKVTQRSIFITTQGDVQYYAHGHLLRNDHQVYQDHSELNVHSLKAFPGQVLRAVSNFRLYDICSGVSNKKYEKFWLKTPNCYIDRNDFQEMRYSITCRSAECKLIVPQQQRKCISCTNLFKKFARRKYIDSPTKLVTPPKTKPLKFMSTPEKFARVQRDKKTIKNLKRQNARLVENIENLLQKESVEVDENLNSDIVNILEEAKKSKKLTETQEIFLEQQVKASTLKDKRSMRWHPLLIRLAIQLKMISSSAYRTLSQYVSLPSERTLFDYTHVMETKEGCNLSIIRSVAEKVQSFEKPYQSYHALIFDEITISQNLVQKKETGEIIGYCKLNELQEEFLHFSTALQNAAQNLNAATFPKPPTAKKMLSFLVKGTASSVQSVVSSSVSTLSKEDLHLHVWEVIECLEMHGIKVCALVCDGSSTNRGFFDLHKPRTVLDDGGIEINVIFDTVNPYDPGRAIYFISDPPHLLKTIRNGLFNSGKKNCRRLYKNGEYMLWNTIVKLYKNRCENTVDKLHKLTSECVYLNSFSCMKVCYAARVISKSVANRLDELGWPNSRELSLFEEN